MRAWVDTAFQFSQIGPLYTASASRNVALEQVAVSWRISNALEFRNEDKKCDIRNSYCCWRVAGFGVLSGSLASPRRASQSFLPLLSKESEFRRLK